MTEPSRVHVARWLSYERLENGILFTADPLHGRRDQALISASQEPTSVIGIS